MMTGNGSPVVDDAVVLDIGLGQDGNVFAPERAVDNTDLLCDPAATHSLKCLSADPRDLLGFFKGMHSAEDDDLDEDDGDDDDDDDDFTPDDADDLDDDEEDEDDDDDEDSD